MVVVAWLVTPIINVLWFTSEGETRKLNQQKGLVRVVLDLAWGSKGNEAAHGGGSVWQSEARQQDRRLSIVTSGGVASGGLWSDLVLPRLEVAKQRLDFGAWKVQDEWKGEKMKVRDGPSISHSQAAKWQQQKLQMAGFE
jgi:hypothetical protein